MCFIHSASHARRTYKFLITLRLSVTELWITEFDHISVIGNSQCACAVSRDLSPGGGGQNGKHVWNPWPHFTYSLWFFHLLRRRI